MARGESELDLEGLTQDLDSTDQLLLEPSLSPSRKEESDDESDISSDTDVLE